MVKFEFTMSDVDAENLMRAIHSYANDKHDAIIDIIVNPDLTVEEKRMYIAAYKDSYDYYKNLITHMANYRVYEGDENEFKVGQRWKTRSGGTAIINAVLSEGLFPILGSVGDGPQIYFLKSWMKNGKEYSTQSETPNDLIELIEDAQVKGNEMNTKHKNYAFISAFINGEAIQYLSQNAGWVDIDALRELDYDFEYRVKPKTKIINGFEVPAPISEEPEHGTRYWHADPGCIEMTFETCFNSGWHRIMFERGLCFSNKEDAVQTAKAMLGIDPNS